MNTQTTRQPMPLPVTLAAFAAVLVLGSIAGQLTGHSTWRVGASTLAVVAVLAAAGWALAVLRAPRTETAPAARVVAYLVLLALGGAVLVALMAGITVVTGVSW